MWDFAQLTPLERPGAFANKDAITDEEAEEFAQQRIETSNKDRRDPGIGASKEWRQLSATARRHDRPVILSRIPSLRAPRAPRFRVSANST